MMREPTRGATSSTARTRPATMRRGWSVAFALLAGLVALAAVPGAGATKRVTFDDGRGNVWEEDVYSEAEYEAYKNRWWNKKMTKLPVFVKVVIAIAVAVHVSIFVCARARARGCVSPSLSARARSLAPSLAPSSRARLANCERERLRAARAGTGSTSARQRTTSPGGASRTPRTESRRGGGESRASCRS